MPAVRPAPAGNFRDGKRLSLAAGGLFLLASFVFLYKNVLAELLHIWLSNGNYSHGFLVPLVVGYIIWSERHNLRRTPIRPCRPAVLLVLAAGLLLIGGQLAIHQFSRFTSLFFMIFALTLTLFGRFWLQRLFLPLTFFAFMFPLPELLRRTVTTPLQSLSSIIAVTTMQHLGFAVYREGNVIEIPHLIFSVAEACSGLRSLVALTFLAAVAGYFMLQDNRRRLILFLSAIPIAIVLNWVRITGTILLARHFGRNAAMGFFHQFSGLIIFCLAVVLLFSLVFLLGAKEISHTGHTIREIKLSSPDNRIGLLTFLSIAVILLLLAGASDYLNGLKSNRPIDLQKIPLAIDSYQGRDVPIDPSITKASTVTHDREIVYFQKQGHAAIVAYFGYYRTSKELGGFFHGPGICLTSTGWRILRTAKIALPVAGQKGLAVHARKYVSTKDDATQVMFSWLQAGELTGAGSRQIRIKYFLNILAKLRYDDLTKIIIQTQVAPGETETAATRRLLDFFAAAYPKINAVLRDSENTEIP